MKFDDILKRLGEFGPYQRRIYFLLCLPAISCALHKLVWVFVGAVPPHRCQTALDTIMNHSLPYTLPDEVWNITIPYSWKSGECTRPVTTNFTWDISQQSSNSSNQSDIAHEYCDRWVYDTSQYKSTIVNDFNLVCHRSWLRALVQSLFMGGELVGSIVWGSISDRYGRRLVFFCSVILQAVLGILSGVVSNYYLFLIFRTLVGLFTPGVFLVGFVIGLELVGPSKRLVAGIGCQFFFATGYLLTALAAYLIRDWQYLQIAISLPGLCFVAYWWVVPESARWLLAKRQVDSAKRVLQKVAKINGTELPEEFTQGHEEEEEAENPEGKNPLVLFKYPNLRKKTLILCFTWFVNSGVYYGLVLNSSNLGGDDYINFIIGALLEYPAYIYCIFFLNKHGRRLPLAITMIIAGLSLFATIFISTDESSIMVLLAMIGKLGITTSYAIIFVFSAELYPTVIRNMGMGLSSTCARVGGVISPFVVLLADHWRPLPLIIFGVFSFVSGLLSLLLPETRKCHLPDTIAEGEEFGRPT